MTLSKSVSSMLFQNEFDDDPVFEFQNTNETPVGDENIVLKADDDVDSVVSNEQTFTKITRKSHLELLLQKANSISGIRKMNMQFKQERREMRRFKTKISPEGYEHRSTITKQYWNLCQDFLEMMEIKRS